MQPVLMIGCGGSGTKVVRHIRDAVHRRLLEIGWDDGIPSCWRFLGIDTPTTQEAASEIPPLPADDYLSIGSRFRTYPDLFRALESQNDDIASNRALLSGWLPDPERARVPLAKGAGQCRAIGRAAVLDSLSRSVPDLIRAAFQDIRGGQHELDAVTRYLGFEVSGDTERGQQDPLVLVCSSIGGGTGAGIALDVVDILRALDPAGAHPVMALLTNDIFEMEHQGALAANSLAFISEMLAAYWSKEGQIESPALVSRTVDTRGSGPHSVFLIGREQHGGSTFRSTAEVYLAVGEALSTWVTSDVVQEEITNFLVANWQSHAGDAAKLNSGGYPFDEIRQDGALSSFGVAKVSVGRDRFDRWAEHKLARSTMEMLISGHLRLNVRRDSKLTDDDWVEQLGRQRADAVFGAEVRGNNSGGGLATAETFFAGDDAVSTKQAEALRRLAATVGGQSMPAAAIHDHIKNCATRIKDEFAQSGNPQEVAEWRNRVVSDTCRAVSEVVAATSLPVAITAVDAAREICGRQAAAMKEKATEAAYDYQQNVGEGLKMLSRESGNINSNDSVFESATKKIAAGLASEWRNVQLVACADTVAHAADELYGEMLRFLKSADREIVTLLESDAVAEWPSPTEQGVSIKYHPSAIELPLEDHSEWNGRLAELCAEATEPGVDCGNLPIDPVRYLMVAGHSSGAPDEMPSLLHSRKGANWSPGHFAPIECSVGIEYWLDRFRQWANRAGSSYRRYVSEGLEDYLLPLDPHSQQRRIDHADRIAKFRKSLNTARQRSSPMMRLAAGQHSAVSFIRQAFPFKEGHPAAEVVSDVIGEMGEKWVPAQRDMPSVMLISYFEVPTHPLAVGSITQPIAKEANSLSPGFWQWRRSRRLDAFVPLPRATMENLIRGFAIARLCGLMTVEMDGPCKIAPPDGKGPIERFPWPLLTPPPVAADILATLLESIALCYGAANREDQMAVLRAYKVMYDMGAAHTSDATTDPLRNFVRHGGGQSFVTLDEPKIVGLDEAERANSAEKYLLGQISRYRKFGEVNASRLVSRNRAGPPEKGVLTGELSGIYIPIYEELVEFLKSGDMAEDEI